MNINFILGIRIQYFFSILNCSRPFLFLCKEPDSKGMAERQAGLVGEPMQGSARAGAQSCKARRLLGGRSEGGEERLERCPVGEAEEG